MAKHDKVMEKILLSESDADIAFDDLRGPLLRLRIEERNGPKRQQHTPQLGPESPNFQSC